MGRVHITGLCTVVRYRVLELLTARDLLHGDVDVNTFSTAAATMSTAPRTHFLMSSIVFRDLQGSGARMAERWRAPNHIRLLNTPAEV